MNLPNLERTRFQVIHPQIESYLFHKVEIRKRNQYKSKWISVKLHIYVPVDKPFKSLLELPSIANEIQIKWLDATGSYIDVLELKECQFMSLDTSDSMDIHNDKPLSVALGYTGYVK